MPSTLTRKTGTCVNRARRPNHRLAGGRSGLDVPILPSASVLVLTVEDAARKLETLAHEALGVLGQIMRHVPDDALRVRAAGLVLRAWERSQGKAR